MSQSSSPGPFDAARLRARKRRAAASGAEAILAPRVALDLADRLAAVNRRFDRSLVVGGSMAFLDALVARPEAADKAGFVIAADVTPAGLPPSRGMAFDLERWPTGPRAFGLIISVLALHAVNDLVGALTQARLSLRPDGLLLAAMFGGDTLHELRSSLLEAEAERTGGAALRVAPMADARALGGVLQRAGFALPVVDVDRLVVRYREPLRLLADLRAMGETAALAGPIAPLRRDVLARALALYRLRHADPDGRVRATFEIITLTGWAPDPCQQQPLRPGAAQARLADAVGAVELTAGERAG